MLNFTGHVSRGPGALPLVLAGGRVPYRLTSGGMLRGLLWLAQILLAALIVYNLADRPWPGGGNPIHRPPWSGHGDFGSPSRLTTKRR